MSSPSNLQSQFKQVNPGAVPTKPTTRMLNLITSLVAFHHIKPNMVPTNSTLFMNTNPWTCKGKNNFQHANPSKAPIKSIIFIALKPSLRFSLPFNTSSQAQCLHISPSSLFFSGRLVERYVLICDLFSESFSSTESRDLEAIPQPADFKNSSKERCLENSLLEAHVKPSHCLSTWSPPFGLEIQPSSCCSIHH